VVLNHFAEGSQIQIYNFVREPHKKFYHKSIDTFGFSALTKSVTQKIRGVTESYWKTLHTYRKESFPSKEWDTNLLQSIYVA